MTVYVDDVRHSYGRMIMCHMWADTLDELYRMADIIGVQRKWLQQPPKASWVHFDVSLGAKAKALAAGALLTDMFGPVEFEAKLKLQSDKEAIRVQGQRQLERIAYCRKLREHLPEHGLGQLRLL